MFVKVMSEDIVGPFYWDIVYILYVCWFSYIWLLHSIKSVNKYVNVLQLKVAELFAWVTADWLFDALDQRSVPDQYC